MKTKSVSLSRLVEDDLNARSHGKRNRDAIRRSLEKWGQVEPLVVQAGTNRVIGGNGRLAEMRELGWSRAAVVEVEVSDMEARALGIALNRTAELAEWNNDTLKHLLAAIRESESVELDDVGFSGREAALLMGAAAGGTGEDPGPQDPPEQPRSKRGDVWVLGRHRLMCGDSTDPDDVARLMDGQRASLLATDPPYLVDYDGTNHPADHHKKAGRKANAGKEVGNKHWDAYIDPESSVTFFSALLRVALEHCVERVPVYQWHATRRQALIEQAVGTKRAVRPPDHHLGEAQSSPDAKPLSMAARALLLWLGHGQDAVEGAAAAHHCNNGLGDCGRERWHPPDPEAGGDLHPTDRVPHGAGRGLSRALLRERHTDRCRRADRAPVLRDGDGSGVRRRRGRAMGGIDRRHGNARGGAREARQEGGPQEAHGAGEVGRAYRPIRPRQEDRRRPAAVLPQVGRRRGLRLAEAEAASELAVLAIGQVAQPEQRPLQVARRRPRLRTPGEARAVLVCARAPGRGV